jgi:hypothetical protein
MPANDTDGSIVLWRDVRRVRAYLRRRIYGQSGSITMEGRSLAPNHIAMLYLPWGGVRRSGKDASRDGGTTRSGGDDPPGRPPLENPARRVFE